MTPDAGEEFLRSQLERSFRELVFLSRVSLKDLALIFPHAERCAGRKVKQYSEVARFLPELGPGGAGGRREVVDVSEGPTAWALGRDAQEQRL